MSKSGIFRLGPLQHRSSSGADEALFVSRPAISKRVREFEAQLRSSLLERGSGGVHLTEAGYLLIQHAQPSFTAEQAAPGVLAALHGF
jgi:DNA-binding transcriptional LysR family regulator